MEPWWIQKSVEAAAKDRLRAVAYYRHSAEIGQENSVEIQHDNVVPFAQKHDIEIIHEFADRGKSGLNAEGRPAFNEMMEWVRTRDDFQLVLVLDVSRWGRFQDTDLSAHYESLCTQHGKQVIYTNIGFGRDEDRLINQLRKSIDRYQSAEYSRTLSKKVYEGAAKVARQGYRPGGSPPYAFHRMMLDEKKQPDRILLPGQRKAIQNGRVILVPGEPAQIQIVQEIFFLFVEKGLDERQIAGQLNARGIPSPGGARWSEGSVRHILTNQQYAGCVVYNKTTQRLKTPTRLNPIKDWIITPGAYQEVVPPELFAQAQKILEARQRRYEPAEMLANLRALYAKYHVITSQLIRFEKTCPSPTFYAQKFGGVSGAFQALFGDTVNRVKETIRDALSQTVRLDAYEDFLVVNERLTVLVQPSVPIPAGYGTFWAFRPDTRPVIDITLGVPLGGGDSTEVLGYLALPRLMVREPWVRLSSSSDARIELQGYNGLDLIRELTQ